MEQSWVSKRRSRSGPLLPSAEKSAEQKEARLEPRRNKQNPH